MRWMARALALGFAALVAAQVGACGGAQVTVGVPAARPSCASVCQQMAPCPGKGPACPQSCQAAESVSTEAGCQGSMQAELDCLGAQPEVCSASQGACRTQTAALGACIANYCAHPRVGDPTIALCLQAAAGF